jgi:hypothetical protein
LNGRSKNALHSKFAGQYGFALVLLTVVSQRCSCYRGKNPEKPKRFFWPLQGGPEGNRNPSGLVFFCQRFLLEKQKKMLDGSRNFLIWVLTLKSALLTANQYREVFYVPAVCARSAA